MSIESFSDVELALSGIESAIGSQDSRISAVELYQGPDIATQISNLSLRLDAVEERLTARETAHMAILQQQTDLIQQLSSKLQGVLEVKPEIMPYEYELAKGVLDQVTGYRLRADATAQRKFTGQLLMVFVLMSTGQIPSDHPIGFWTHDGVRHELPASEYIGMVIRYGMGISAIEEQF